MVTPQSIENRLVVLSKEVDESYKDLVEAENAFDLVEIDVLLHSDHVWVEVLDVLNV